MLTVVVCANDSAAELAGLLAALVPAAVDGLVREVIVTDPAPRAEIRAICEDAGAELAPSFAEAAAQAHYEVVLVLPAGMRLRAGWEAAVGERLARGGGPASLAGERDGWFRRPPVGVLTGRDRLAAAKDLAGLRRSASRRI